MNELKLYFKQNNKKVYVVDSIKFDPVKAGKTTNLILFAENQIKYPIDVEIKIDDSAFQIINNKFTVPSKQTYETMLKVRPKITRTTPLVSKFNVKINYIIK